MTEMRYFFAYARDDSDFVVQLAKRLRGAGVNLWLDQLDILPGQHWDRAVEQALKTCEGMIVVLSPESVASDNVMDEVSFALNMQLLVVPVLLRSCDIPFRLQRVQHVDFIGDYETGLVQLLRGLGIQELPSDRQALATPVSQSPEETPDASRHIQEPHALPPREPSVRKASARINPAQERPPEEKPVVSARAEEPQVDTDESEAGLRTAATTESPERQASDIGQPPVPTRHPKIGRFLVSEPLRLSFATALTIGVAVGAGGFAVVGAVTQVTTSHNQWAILMILAAEFIMALVELPWVIELVRMNRKKPPLEHRVYVALFGFLTGSGLAIGSAFLSYALFYS